MYIEFCVRVSEKTKAEEHIPLAVKANKLPKLSLAQQRTSYIIALWPNHGGYHPLCPLRVVLNLKGAVLSTLKNSYFTSKEIVAYS